MSEPVEEVGKFRDPSGLGVGILVSFEVVEQKGSDFLHVRGLFLHCGKERTALPLSQITVEKIANGFLLGYFKDISGILVSRCSPRWLFMG